LPFCAAVQARLAAVRQEVEWGLSGRHPRSGQGDADWPGERPM